MHTISQILICEYRLEDTISMKVREWLCWLSHKSSLMSLCHLSFPLLLGHCLCKTGGKIWFVLFYLGKSKHCKVVWGVIKLNNILKVCISCFVFPLVESLICGTQVNSNICYHLCCEVISFLLSFIWCPYIFISCIANTLPWTSKYTNDLIYNFVYISKWRS